MTAVASTAHASAAAKPSSTKMPARIGTASEQTILTFFLTRESPFSSANDGCVPSVPESTTATEKPSPVRESRAPSPSTSTAPSWTGTARVAWCEVSVNSTTSSSAQSTRVTPAVVASRPTWVGVPTATAMPTSSRLASGVEPGGQRGALGGGDAAAGLHHHPDRLGGGHGVEVREQRRLQHVGGDGVRAAEPGLGRDGGQQQGGGGRGAREQPQ